MNLSFVAAYWAVPVMEPVTAEVTETGFEADLILKGFWAMAGAALRLAATISKRRMGAPSTERWAGGQLDSRNGRSRSKLH
jgi:hypothetical protein